MPATLIQVLKPNMYRKPLKHFTPEPRARIEPCALCYKLLLCAAASEAGCLLPPGPSGLTAEDCVPSCDICYRQVMSSVRRDMHQLEYSPAHFQPQGCRRELKELLLGLVTCAEMVWMTQQHLRNGQFPGKRTYCGNRNDSFTVGSLFHSACNLAGSCSQTCAVNCHRSPTFFAQLAACPPVRLCSHTKLPHGLTWS